MANRQRARLKELAAEGNPWAVATLAKAKPKDDAFAEAMAAATDIRQWTDGPRASSWRIYRLALALTNA